MIVVVEGIDRVGKTTLVDNLVENGFIDIKDKFLVSEVPNIIKYDDFPAYSLGKCESFVVLAEKLDKEGKNVVIDRLHLTELVYGAIDRAGRVSEVGCLTLDCLLAKMGALLCLVNPTDINFSSEMAGRQLKEHNKLFSYYYSLSSMDKISCDYSTLDAALNEIITRACKYDFYFASPFFKPEQVEREERMKRQIRKFGFKVYSPKEVCNLESDASQKSREQVFNDNCNAIKSSRAVFAVTDGKDVGTIWEAGYAHGIGKPVVYYAETLGDNLFNLMLAQSGNEVFTSQNEVTYGALIDAILGFKKPYKGAIE